MTDPLRARCAELEAEVKRLKMDLFCEREGTCKICGSCGTLECGCTHKCKYAAEHPDVVAQISALQAKVDALMAGIDAFLDNCPSDDTGPYPADGLGVNELRAIASLRARSVK